MFFNPNPNTKLQSNTTTKTTTILDPNPIKFLNFRNQLDLALQLALGRDDIHLHEFSPRQFINEQHQQSCQSLTYQKTSTKSIKNNKHELDSFEKNNLITKQLQNKKNVSLKNNPCNIKQQNQDDSNSNNKYKITSIQNIILKTTLTSATKSKFLTECSGSNKVNIICSDQKDIKKHHNTKQILQLDQNNVKVVCNDNNDDNNDDNDKKKLFVNNHNHNINKTYYFSSNQYLQKLRNKCIRFTKWTKFIINFYQFNKPLLLNKQHLKRNHYHSPKESLDQMICSLDDSLIDEFFKQLIQKLQRLQSIKVNNLLQEQQQLLRNYSLHNIVVDGQQQQYQQQLQQQHQQQQDEQQLLSKSFDSLKDQQKSNNIASHVEKYIDSSKNSSSCSCSQSFKHLQQSDQSIIKLKDLQQIKLDLIYGLLKKQCQSNLSNNTNIANNANNVNNVNNINNVNNVNNPNNANNPNIANIANNTNNTNITKQPQPQLYQQQLKRLQGKISQQQNQIKQLNKQKQLCQKKIKHLLQQQNLLQHSTKKQLKVFSSLLSESFNPSTKNTISAKTTATAIQTLTLRNIQKPHQQQSQFHLQPQSEPSTCPILIVQQLQQQQQEILQQNNLTIIDGCVQTIVNNPNPIPNATNISQIFFEVKKQKQKLQQQNKHYKVKYKQITAELCRIRSLISSAHQINKQDMLLVQKTIQEKQKSRNNEIINLKQMHANWTESYLKSKKQKMQNLKQKSIHQKLNTRKCQNMRFRIVKEKQKLKRQKQLKELKEIKELRN